MIHDSVPHDEGGEVEEELEEDDAGESGDLYREYSHICLVAGSWWREMDLARRPLCDGDCDRRHQCDCLFMAPCLCCKHHLSARVAPCQHAARDGWREVAPDPVSGGAAAVRVFHVRCRVRGHLPGEHGVRSSHTCSVHITKGRLRAGPCPRPAPIRSACGRSSGGRSTAATGSTTPR
jgi:hypothetical protein